MPRSVYSGTLGWGLVTVPIKAYSARAPRNVKFNQINSATGNRISQKRVDSVTGDEVAYENIVKGYELTPGNYVTIDGGELEELSPKQTKRIDIEQFVHLAEIDPLVYDDSYFLAPDTGAEKVYGLLADVMLADGRAAIGKIVLRSKQKLCVIRPNTEKVLVCSTVVWADEVNDHIWIAAPLHAPENASSEAERKQAGLLIEALAKPFNHREFKDEYRARVMELIEAKAAGEELVSDEPEVETAAAPDLLAALTASVAAVEQKPTAVPAAALEKAAA